MIRRGVTSEEHEECIRFICKKLGLAAIEIKGNSNIKGKYFPDAISNGTDYEVEVVPRKHYLIKKVDKWDKDRKKVLILRPNSFAYENFDEIYIFSDNNLIKIK